MGWCASLSNKWEWSIWMEWIPLRLLWLLGAKKMKSYHVGTCWEVAELGHSSVEQVDVVEKADCCNWIEKMLLFYHLHILTCSQSRTYFGIFSYKLEKLALQHLGWLMMIGKRDDCTGALLKTGWCTFCEYSCKDVYSCTFVEMFLCISILYLLLFTSLIYIFTHQS